MITPFVPDEVLPYYPTVIDIETAPDGTVLDIALCYIDAFNARQLEIFPDWYSFTRRLMQLIRDHANNRAVRYRLTHIYAHNGNGFDWLSYIRYLIDEKALDDINVMMSEQMVIGTILTFANKQKVYLCDSIRLMPYALKKIAEVLNIDHTKIYIGDYITRMDEFKATKPDEYYHYLREDVLALQEAIYRFWCKIYELEGSIGQLPLTLPALALKIFRKQLRREISTPWNDDIRAFTRRAYTGGRVECYRPGVHETTRVYDVNSMYPAMMATVRVPVSHRVMRSISYAPHKCGFYEVTYNQTDTTLPPVLRDEKTKEFTYSGRGVYYAGELAKFAEIGGTFDVHNGYVFQHTDVLFTDFVTKYYQLRQTAKQTGDGATDFIAKILMNSLYGKFGQSDVRKSIELASNEKIRQYLAEKRRFRMMDDFILLEETERSEHEFVAIAAIITAMARVTLYSYIQQVPHAYVYGDTDSVHINSGTLPESEGLGGLKLETEGRGIYLGRKLYSVGPKIKAKGIGRTITRGHLTPERLEQLLTAGTTESVSYTTMPTLKGVLYGGQQPCAPIERTRKIRRTS